MSLFSQESYDSTKSKWIFSSHGESYLAISENGKRGEKISDFQFNHNRLNTPAINHVAIGVKHVSKRLRIETALHTGTYVRDNYSAENSLLRSFYKAFAGFRIDSKKNTWVDAGIFPSYIGFESVNPFDNITVSRSLLAENSPYYLTGLRINHPLKQRGEITFYLLTGWQRIAPQRKNSLPSFGWQWNQQLKDNSLLNWSFYGGSDQPDASRKMRYFNNLYWQKQYRSWTFITGMDIGAEQTTKASNRYNFWWSPIFITGYALSEKWKGGVRMEHYSDRNSVIIKTKNGDLFNSSGFSMNIDYKPTSSIMFRAEFRKLSATKKVFYTISPSSDQISQMILSISYRLSQLP